MKALLPFLMLLVATNAEAARRCSEALATFSEVEKGLYLSAAPRDESALDIHSVDAIVKVMQPWEGPTYETSRRVVEVAISDETPAEPAVLLEGALALSKLRKDNSVVLVHCREGISRSTTIVALYLMGRYDLSWDEAVERLKRAREWTRPHPRLMSEKTRDGIVEELKKFWKSGSP